MGRNFEACAGSYQSKFRLIHGILAILAPAPEAMVPIPTAADHYTN